jgi:hypothetical protein
MIPAVRTTVAVLAQFIGAVLRQFPRRSSLVDTRILLAAVAAARASKN